MRKEWKESWAAYLAEGVKFGSGREAEGPHGRRRMQESSFKRSGLGVRKFRGGL